MTKTDTPPSMRERLQRLLAGLYWNKALQGPLGNAWITRAEFIETRWTEFADDADAILTELQEPSEWMSKAGDAVQWDEVMNEWAAMDAAAIWRAMIQHIKDGGQ